jgi:hypothetical protein
MIDIPGNTKSLIVDEMDLQSGDARIGARVGDLGFTVLFKLDGPGGLARGREAFGGLATWRG